MHKLLHCNCGSKWQEEVFTALRVVTGLAFFFHGYDKVFVKGVSNVVPFFDSVGIPLAQITTYLVAYAELIGGLMLIVGFLTHWVSKVNILIVLGAIGFVHFGTEGGWFWGYGAPGGYEYQLLLLVVSIFFLAFGSGKYSVDDYLSNKETSLNNTDQPKPQSDLDL
jgi:putative oxidoreductase